MISVGILKQNLNKIWGVVGQKSLKRKEKKQNTVIQSQFVSVETQMTIKREFCVNLVVTK